MAVKLWVVKAAVVTITATLGFLVIAMALLATSHCSYYFYHLLPSYA